MTRCMFKHSARFSHRNFASVRIVFVAVLRVSSLCMRYPGSKCAPLSYIGSILQLAKHPRIGISYQTRGNGSREQLVNHVLVTFINYWLRDLHSKNNNKKNCTDCAVEVCLYE